MQHQLCLPDRGSRRAQESPTLLEEKLAVSTDRSVRGAFLHRRARQAEISTAHLVYLQIKIKAYR